MRGANDRHGLKIRRAADDLARMAAGPLEQHVEGRADAARHESGLLPLDGVLQALQPLVFHALRQLVAMSAAGVPGRGEYLNE